MRLTAALLLCASAAAGGTQDDPERFVSKPGNYSVVVPDGWVRTRIQNEIFQLALAKNNNFLGVSGLETVASPESLVSDMEEEQEASSEGFTTLSKTEVRVAGARGLRLAAEAKRNGLKLRLRAVFFCHQGIAYRVVGVHVLGPFAAFEADVQALLDSFRFLAERKDWVARFVGKPADGALLGGLAGFRLNRPRWGETTFEAEAEGWPYVEHAVFALLSGSAWIKLRARETANDEAGELEELRHDLAGRIGNARAEARFGTAAGERRYLLITGDYENLPFQFSAAVLVRDGLALHAWLECYAYQAETVRPDWESFLASLSLQSPAKPAVPPAYEALASGVEQARDVALDAWLKKAQRVLAADNVLAVSPDGSRALGWDRQTGAFVAVLASGKREALALDPAPDGWAEWSKDRRTLVYGAGPDACVATIDAGEARRLPDGLRRAAFGPADGTLVAVRGGPDTERFVAQTLEILGPGDGEKRVLASHPLARFGFPAVSPDGRSVAFTSNRDIPRSAQIGGHLCVSALDGSGLRTLTSGPEEIQAVRWASDGKRLYVVRRLSEGVDGAVGGGGSSDLWRVSPESGEAVNLTRSGRIGGVWAADDDVLFLQVEGWDLPPAQRGLFRIGAAELEKSTSSRPVPPPHRPRAAGERVSAAVRAVAGPGPVRELVPTPALMEKAAVAFAAAVRESTGRALDFAAGSLGLLRVLCGDLGMDEGGDPALLLGMGAYYGETLRRAAGAEWKLQPVPFGDATPSTAVVSNLLAEVVCPFNDILAVALDSESRWIKGEDELGANGDGLKLILVHPPAAAEKALQEASGPDYAALWKKLDAGEVEPALEGLLTLLRKNPDNRALARDLVALCGAVGRADAARDVVRAAVESGTRSPELLLRYADEIEPTDPEKALEVLRRGASGRWPNADVLIRMGKIHAGRGRRALAESCWRRAHASHAGDRQAEIVRLMSADPARSDE